MSCINLRSFALILLTSFCWAQNGDYQRAKEKLDDIDKAPRGSQILVTERELNAYIAGEIPQVVGEGAVKSSHLTLTEGAGVMHARVDFIRLQKNTGRQPGWLMQKMLEGEKDVVVAARIQSSHERATVWVDRVEVGGMNLPGPLLDFLLEVFIQPQFPYVKIGEPFHLRRGVDHFEVHRGQVRIFMRR
ncbi:MAG: hypothetical protein ABI693_08735 [Bryobacteraceae bacterium]